MSEDIEGVNAATIRRDALKVSGVDMPISGGSGSTKDDPIIINEPDSARSAYWVEQVVGFIHRMRGENYKFEKSTISDYKDRVIEQYKISREGDDDFLYNYYFDVSAVYDDERSKEGK